MDALRIRLICDRSVAECWSFVRFMEELEASGVAMFRFNIMSGEREYMDGQGLSLFETPIQPRMRSVAPTIDAAAVSGEFRHFLYSVLTVDGLFDALASCGVQFLEVDPVEGRCSFFGHAVRLDMDPPAGMGDEEAGSAHPDSAPSRPDSGSRGDAGSREEQEASG